jgi:hypothetical protein
MATKALINRPKTFVDQQPKDEAVGFADVEGPISTVDQRPYMEDTCHHLIGPE